ncbi:hypothetical protein ACFL4G_01115 [Thermodesulfobacteriota bacterium]
MVSGQVQNQRISLHGVLVDVLDIGILISGKSGIGKSECALDLVQRGHRLVADDLIELRKTPSKGIVGSGSEIIRHSMEVRGVGVIDVEALFGICAVLDSRRVDLVIEMEEWDPQMEYERLGMEQLSTEIMGVEIPLVRIPVSPGRNMATIVEVAARNQILLRRGRNSALELEKRILKETTSALPDDGGGE